jgi:hypothetical protein|tara:strand:- start:3870 stop:4058 length:189 start_codon:yes stop_codon:yes gene_type:complete
MENLMSKILKEEVDDHIYHLEKANEWFRSRIKKTDTGYLYTTIATLTHRIKRLKENKNFDTL